MRVRFSKYQGAGNDFILIKDITGEFPQNDHKLINKMCDRKFGIGADGLMLLRGAVKNDFTMLYYNANGFEGTMCGNGGRCLVKFAKDSGYINNEQGIVFNAVDGEHKADILNSGLVSLQMKDVGIIREMGAGFGLDTGSMHHVEYVDKLVDMDVYRRGRTLRAHDMYKPVGCNVNFIQEENDGSISIRTYEKGVENETLACGTGSVAAAMVHHHLGHIKDEYVINARGGTLRIRFNFNNGKYENVWLLGPAEFVFAGEWTI